MKILPLLLLTMLLAPLARAENIQCTTTVKERGGATKSTKVLINLAENFVEVEGRREAILARAEAKIPGVPAFLQAMAACRGSADALKCSDPLVQDFTGRDQSLPALEGMARLGVLFLYIFQQAPAEERYADIEIDLSRIAAAKAYQVGAASKFGIPGIFEYLDAQGQLLGRFMVATPFVIPCN